MTKTLTAFIFSALVGIIVTFSGGVNADEIIDYYTRLHLKPNAGNSEIEIQWKVQMRLHYPDRFLHDPQLVIEKTKLTQEINNAHDVLTDMDLRYYYDLVTQSGHHHELWDKLESRNKENLIAQFGIREKRKSLPDQALHLQKASHLSFDELVKKYQTVNSDESDFYFAMLIDRFPQTKVSEQEHFIKLVIAEAEPSSSLLVLLGSFLDVLDPSVHPLMASFLNHKKASVRACGVILLQYALSYENHEVTGFRLTLLQVKEAFLMALNDRSGDVKIAAMVALENTSLGRDSEIQGRIKEFLHGKSYDLTNQARQFLAANNTDTKRERIKDILNFILTHAKDITADVTHNRLSQGDEDLPLKELNDLKEVPRDSEIQGLLNRVLEIDNFKVREIAARLLMVSFNNLSPAELVKAYVYAPISDIGMTQGRALAQLNSSRPGATSEEKLLELVELIASGKHPQCVSIAFDYLRASQTSSRAVITGLGKILAKENKIFKKYGYLDAATKMDKILDIFKALPTLDLQNQKVLKAVASGDEPHFQDRANKILKASYNNAKKHLDLGCSGHLQKLTQRKR